MAYGLVRFAGSAGPELFAVFVKRLADLDLPPPPLPMRGRKYGFWVDSVLRDRLDATPYSHLFAIGQRIYRMANRPGLNALREAAAPPLLISNIFRRWKSALPRALFLYLEHNATFVAGEAILSSSSYWNSRYFFDCFACHAGVPLAEVRNGAGFNRGVERIISRSLEDDVEVSVDRTLLMRGFPGLSETVCVFVLRYGDRSRPIAVWSRAGTEMLSVPRERLVVLIYDRRTGQLAITGRALGREDFEEVAALFNREVLKARDPPPRLPRETYDLHSLLNNRRLSAPAKSNVVEVGSTGIAYFKGGVTSTRHFKSSQSIWGALATAFGADWVEQELHLITMSAVELRIDLQADEDNPKGRTIKVRILRDRYVIDGGCHADRINVERVIDHLGIRNRRGRQREFAI